MLLTRRIFVSSAEKKILFAGAMMLFFWALCDGIMSFVTPLIISERGISDTELGFIIGFSSVTGAFFDFILCRFLPYTNFRRVFGAMLIVAAFFPLVMWGATTVTLFLIAMAIWGLYYDLYSIGSFDFVSRVTKNEEPSSSFGPIHVLTALGNFCAPIIAGVLMGTAVGVLPLVGALTFLGCAGFLYLILLYATRSSVYSESRPRRSVGILREIRVWRKLGTRLLPVLAITLVLNIADGFYWTVGPLFAEQLSGLGRFSGLFLGSFIAPTLIVGWFVGKITLRYGQKRTAIVCLFLGSLVLTAFLFVKNAFLLIAVNFVSSFFLSIAYPAISGAYINFIVEARKIETEIETIEDSSTNLGWVIGPILAGVMSDAFGYRSAFAFLGILGMVVALLIWHITPRHIHVASLAR